MTRGLTRTTFNRSGLVRILSGTLPEAVDPKYDLGERLGQWLDFTDALALSSVLNNETGAASAVHATATPAASALQEQLARVRRNLSESILNDGVYTGAETARIRFPVPLPQATAESAADFLPYHRYYLAHQRDMSGGIGALRGNARQALAKVSAAHRQLAELDVAFEKALTTRERNLLATIPMLLARRFAQRHQEYRDTLTDYASDDPATWAAPGGWLEAFCRDTQTVLLAELELRLKPVAGLIAALGGTGDTSQSPMQ
jgi:hypothetical protein